MSCKPNGFGLNEPTGRGVLASWLPPQSEQFASIVPTVSPHQYRVDVWARAAYSHSASVGRRYFSPVDPDNQRMYCCASSQLTLCTGVRSSAFTMRGVKLQPPPATHAFHSPTVTGYWPMAKAGTVTVC